jgi:hypothetical protein
LTVVRISTANAKQAEAFMMPLDNGGRRDKQDRLQTAWPQSVEPNPEQAVDREQSGPPRSLVTKNAKLMAEGGVL